MNAEEAILGAAMLSAEAADECMQLSESDFTLGRYRSVFRAIRALHAKGHGVDAVAVGSVIPDSELEQMPHGRAFLFDLTGSCMNTASANSYADKVRKEADRRRLLQVAAEITAQVNSGCDPDDIKANAHLAMEGTGGKAASRTIRDIIGSNLPSYEHARETFTLGDWDIRLRAGTMSVVGARPAVGKSAFALQTGEELASRHVRTRVYSYEMSDTDWAERAIARATGITVDRLDDGIGADGVRFLAEQTDQAWCDSIDITDAASMRPEQVLSDMRRFARAGGRVAIVDYLQLMTKQDYEHVTEISRQLKLTARASGLSLIVLSQLKRLGDNDNRAPRLSDLRQSGAIEQDADDVILLHGYADHNEDTDARSKMKSRGYLLEHDDPESPMYKRLSHVHRAKARRGKERVMPAWFDGAEMRWTRVEQTADERRP